MKGRRSAREKSYLYQRVAGTLRERIATGRYKPETRLPSLYELVDEFDVSVITVRRALRELAYEGVIRGEQGRGVFVKDKSVVYRVFAADGSRGFTAELQRNGTEVRLRDNGIRRIAADDAVAARLGIRKGRAILMHEKVAYADEQPVSLHRLYFDEAVGETLRAHAGKEFLFSLLGRLREPIGHIDLEFGAAPLTQDQAAMFRLPAGFPMSFVHSTPLRPDGTALLTASAICRSDRFMFEVQVPVAPRGAAATKTKPKRAPRLAKPARIAARRAKEQPGGLGV